MPNSFVENVNSVASVITSGVLDPNAEGYSNAVIATTMANVCTSIYDQFDDRYLGAKGTAPLVDNDGNALVYGTLYFDTTQNFMKVWSNAGWINSGSSINGTTERYTYHATAGQTVFSATYEAGYIDVFLNGSKLENGVDFTAVTATDITLTVGANIGDVVDIICYAVFKLSTAPTKDVVAYTVSTVDDLASVPSIYTTTIVKDLNRGGTFIWSATGTVNGGTIFAGASGYWVRQYDGAVNVKWFGAVGLVDFDATTNTEAIRAAIEASSVVYVPAGHYVINDYLPLDKDLIFYGDGLEETLFTCSDSTKSFMKKQDTSGFIKVDIHSFWVNYNSKSAPAFHLGGNYQTGATTWVERSSFRNIRIRNAMTAFYNSSGAYAITFKNIYIDDCTYGFTWYYGTTLSFDNVQVGVATRAYYFYNVFSITMLNCGTDGGTTEISNAMCDFVSVVGLNIISFASEGVTVKGNDAAFWRFEGCHSCRISGTYHLGLTFDGNSGGYPTYVKMYNSCNAISFSNINLALPSNSAYYIGSPSAIYIFLGGDALSDVYSVTDCVFPTLVKNDAGSSCSVYVTQDNGAVVRNCSGGGYYLNKRNEMTYSDAVPSGNFGAIGTVVYSNAPANLGFVGWVKTTSSVWKTFGAITA